MAPGSPDIRSVIDLGTNTILMVTAMRRKDGSLQILDDAHEMYAGIRPDQRCGSLYGIRARDDTAHVFPAGEWQSLRVYCVGTRIAVSLNGTVVADANLSEHEDKTGAIPGIGRRQGFPALQNERGPVDFRDPAFVDLAEEAQP